MSDFSNLVSPEIVVPTPKTRSYRSFLINLGRQLKKDDLNDLKFALRGTIPEGELENLNDPLQIFIALEHRCLLRPDNVNTLRGYLKDIGRPNLIKMLDKYVCEDVHSKCASKQRSDDRLDKDGDSSQKELVEVRGGSKYSLTFANQHNQRCKVNVVVDGYEMFSSGCLLLPKQTITIERPIRIVDLQPGLGTSNWHRDDHGVMEVSPEKTDIKITCVVASDTESGFTTLWNYAPEVVWHQTENYYQTEDYYPTEDHYSREHYYRVNEDTTYNPVYTDPTIVCKCFMKETESLIKDYIGYRLRSRFKQSNLDGISCEILVPPRLPSNRANILRAVALNLEAENESLFRRIPCLIDLSDSKAESTFHGIAKWVFSDEVFNWGRIVALITFTGALAHHFVEQKRPEKVCEVTQWLLQFIRVHLMTWIIQNGGWDGFVVFANGYEPSWTEVFAVGAITAGITFLVLVNK